MYIAVPAPDLAVVEGGEDAALWVEARHLNRCDRRVNAMRNTLYPCNQHVMANLLGHWVALEQAQ